MCLLCTKWDVEPLDECKKTLRHGTSQSTFSKHHVGHGNYILIAKHHIDTRVTCRRRRNDTDQTLMKVVAHMASM